MEKVSAPEGTSGEKKEAAEACAARVGLIEAQCLAPSSATGQVGKGDRVSGLQGTFVLGS